MASKYAPIVDLMCIYGGIAKGVSRAATMAPKVAKAMQELGIFRSRTKGVASVAQHMESQVRNDSSAFKIGLLSVEDANASFVAKGMRPPYAETVRPRTIQLKNDVVLLRVFERDENFAGQWMLRGKSVEGLTPKQIQDKFALPSMPTKIVEAHIPAGSYIRVGRAAAQPGWGGGGGMQYESLERLSRSTFQNIKTLSSEENYSWRPQP